MRIAVGMSGGVDSTAAALALRDAGHDVFGVTMLVSGVDDSDTAGAAAGALGLRHYVVDLKDAFEREVVEPFVRAYAAGRTPNPCVLCNRALKFGALRKAALGLGADRFATGHYARLMSGGDAPPRLFEAVDGSRDQSYFVAAVPAEALAACLMPLGNITKNDASSLVDAAGLTATVAPESRDICFIPTGDMRSFLEARAPGALRPGPIEDIEGRTLGEHAGLALYTVGQRTGLGLSRPRPTYVLSIEPGRNALVVGDDDDLACGGLEAGDLRWLAGAPPGARFRADVRIRSASPRTPAEIEVRGATAVVSFDEPVRAVAPGQAAVFYRGEEVLGSGTIERGVEAALGRRSGRPR